MVGQERTVLPLLARTVFKIEGVSVILTFLVAFGVTKAFTNLAAGAPADRYGRKPILVASRREEIGDQTSRIAPPRVNLPQPRKRQSHAQSGSCVPSFDDRNGTGADGQEIVGQAQRSSMASDVDLAAAERYLLLADISGYTGFMSGVEQAPASTSAAASRPDMASWGRF